MAPKKINPVKTSTISDLKDLLSKSKSVAIVDYKGLKVTQATDLRRQIKKAGGQMLVTKNTLFSIAANIQDIKLEGASAFIFSLDDEISAIKAVADFAKKNNLPSFKYGLLSDRILSAQEVSALAALPNKTVLITKTVSSLKSPLFRFVYSLNWNLSKLVRVLDAIKNKKS